MSDTTALDGVTEEPTVPDGKEELSYVSKSRITTYMTCPRKFFWRYWCEERAPGTYYTERGTEVHETFERYHENLMDQLEDGGGRPAEFTSLLPEWTLWAQWLEYVGAFFEFEQRRWEAAAAAVFESHSEAETPLFVVDFDAETEARWKPIEVEAEFWLGEPPASWFENDHVDSTPDYVGPEPPVGDAPWMGRADLIVRTASVPGVEGNGVTIIDYKTGTAPTVKYDESDPWYEENLNEGIFLEGEYYGWLAEECPDFDHEVDAVAGYYPKNDELVVAPYPDTDRRRDIKRSVLGMQRPPSKDNFPVEQSGLCHWNNANGEGNCHFHSVCEVRHNCKHCGTKGSSSPTSGSGRYDT